jgi:hypothetical protein
MRMFENGVPGKVFELKRGEVTGEWRRLHNEELMICTRYKILFGRSNQED